MKIVPDSTGACAYAELTALLIEQDIKAEAADLVRECRAGLNALDAFEADAELNGFRAR